jgi:cytochrome c oxidase subunit 2
VTRAVRALVLLALVSISSGCGGDQSTLAPETTPAREIADLWWVMFTGSAIVCAVVIVLVLIAVLRGRGAAPRVRDDRRTLRLVLVAGAVIPFVVLTGLFALILDTLRSTSASAGGAPSLIVRVTGRQWFWDVRYPSGNVVTANEIHLPAGTPVKLEATTADVIHSVWIPRLHRKIDMIPGRTNSLVFDVPRPGVFRGQCAEFCGLQHAKMGLLIVVQPPRAFRRWLAHQAEPARRGAGLATFVDVGCGGCHAIRGTEARGNAAPDLTHLASRMTIAAASLPNRPGYLAGWIVDPQHAKPGAKMPGLDLPGRELQSLLDYLSTLR